MFVRDRDEREGGGHQREIVLFNPHGMADHPLWNPRMDRAYPLDALGLTSQLRSELVLWTREVQLPLNPDRPARMKSLRLVGQDLCARTAEELGPSYDVRWSWDP
jgi:hypothetical protein